MAEFPGFYTKELKAKIVCMEQEGFEPEKKHVILGVIDFLGEMLNQFVVYLHREAYSHPGRRVAWQLIDSRQFGAFAYSHTDEFDERSFDFIGVNLGTLCILYDNYTHLLSSSSVFVGVGEWYKEDSSRSSSWLVSKADDKSPFTIPLCPIRAEFAKLLTITALRFVIFHESAHLYNGHLDWKKNQQKLRSAFLDDFPNVIIPKHDLISHFFEIDADDCALRFTLSHALEFSKSINEKPPTSDVERNAFSIAYGTEKRISFMVVYSLYILFRCTDPGPWDEKYIGFNTHPRGLVRARYMFNRYWELLGTPDDMEMADIMIAAVKSAEGDLADMVGRADDYKSFRDILLSESASKHIIEVGKMQWRLIPELAPYVRGDKFPRPDDKYVQEKINKPYRDL